jgi:hypothetical protein
MANLRRRIPQQTESLFTENHEPFFNSIDPSRHFDGTLGKIIHPRGILRNSFRPSLSSLNYALRLKARGGV